MRMTASLRFMYWNDRRDFEQGRRPKASGLQACHLLVCLFAEQSGKWAQHRIMPSSTTEVLWHTVQNQIAKLWFEKISGSSRRAQDPGPRGLCSGRSGIVSKLDHNMDLAPLMMLSKDTNLTYQACLTTLQRAKGPLLPRSCRLPRAYTAQLCFS